MTQLKYEKSQLTPFHFDSYTILISWSISMTLTLLKSYLVFVGLERGRLPFAQKI